MKKRTQAYVLVSLLLMLAAAYYANRSHVPGFQGVFAEGKFQPLDVHDPQLHLDLLARLPEVGYTGSHRNIFSAAPSIALPAKSAKKNKPTYFQGPQPPPPPPPLELPVQFFGYAAMPETGKRVAFFTSGDDVLVVEEGGAFLNRFRLVRIGNASADVEEISTGRHATLTLVQPPPSSQ